MQYHTYIVIAIHASYTFIFHSTYTVFALSKQFMTLYKSDDALCPSEDASPNSSEDIFGGSCLTPHKNPALTFNNSPTHVEVQPHLALFPGLCAYTR